MSDDNYENSPTLPFEVETVEGLDEPYAKLYSHDESSGKYYLKVEGAVAKSKLAEFRENNVKLLKEMEAIKSQYKDINIDEYKALKEQIAKDGHGSKAFTPDEVEKEVKARVREMETQWETLNKDLENRLKTTQQLLESRVIDGDIRDAFSKVGGMHQTAIDDIILRARAVFKMENGKAIPYEQDGSILYSKDGRSPMTPQEWLTNQKRNNPHWVIQSAGSGASKGNALGANKIEDMTPQQKIAWALGNK